VEGSVKSRKLISLDYGIAGAIILLIAAFGGSELVRALFSATASQPTQATSPEAAGAAVAHINAGVSFDKASDLVAAEAEFRQATQEDPNSAIAYNDLGAVLNRQKRWDEAIAALQRAIELDGALDLAKNNLAYSYSQKAVANNRTSPAAREAAQAHTSSGLSFYNASDFSKAEAEFRLAIRADPDSASAYNNLGAALNQQKRWDEAIAALRRAVELDPKMDMAKNNLVYSLAQKAKGGDDGK
jgi:Flp pilus assembly protein TadD